MYRIGNKWDYALRAEYEKEYFASLSAFLDDEYKSHIVFPPQKDIFTAFRRVDYQDVRVVILGQDPYHGEGQANGMAFAVCEGVSYPRSLNNIFRELKSDLGIQPPNGSLLSWSNQGVLLLNTVLTVRKGQPLSHANAGWQSFTDAVIVSLNDLPHPIIYLLWGRGAISKSSIISPKHHILTSPHPSPLSANRGFFGCKHFSKVNDLLVAMGRAPIDWR